MKQGQINLSCGLRNTISGSFSSLLKWLPGGKSFQNRNSIHEKQDGVKDSNFLSYHLIHRRREDIVLQGILRSIFYSALYWVGLKLSSSRLPWRLNSFLRPHDVLLALLFSLVLEKLTKKIPYVVFQQRKSKLLNNNIPICTIRLWNVISYSKGGIQAKGIWKQNPEANIRAQEKWKLQ